MKKAVFLHGTNGSPADHWWPWLRQRFESSGYEVWAPTLPDNDTPNANTYWNFLTNQGWDFANNILVGHSSGATTILNLLSEPSFPRVKTVVLVGTFLNERLTSKSKEFDEGQFGGLFPLDEFNYEDIKHRADDFYLVHGNDDPYCSYEDAKNAADKLSGELITIPGGGHLSTSFGITELPQLLERLYRDKIL